MLSKACKSVIAVTILFFLVNADLSAQMGAIEIGMARFTQNNDGVINVDLVNKNTNQLIVASLINENGAVVDVAKLNNFSTKVSWKVESGTYKVVLENVKTKEREVHYAVL